MGKPKQTRWVPEDFDTQGAGEEDRRHAARRLDDYRRI